MKRRGGAGPGRSGPAVGPFELATGPEVPDYVVRRVGEILANERVAELLPEGAEIRARIEAMVPAGATLAVAHATWLPARLGALAGLHPLSRQPADAVAPPGLARVAIECVEAPSGGMSSHFGFRGVFVSLLVLVPQGCVWDARIDEAR